MEKYIVESRSNWVEEFDTFDEAKNYLRKKIICDPDTVSHILDLIKKYAEELYPENTPAAFGQLANILDGLMTDPSYPQNLDDCVLDDFEDDNIEFYMDSDSKAIFCYVDNEEYDGKFPLAEINILNTDVEDKEYFFYLTERRNGMCLYWNISLYKSKSQ